jgi:hypothetical protein
LNAIALHTLQIANQLRDGLQPQINTYLPKLAEINAAVWTIASNMSAPLRAMEQGGRPGLRMPVLVGEGGPEIFVPDIMGTIVPNFAIRDLQVPSMPGASLDSDTDRWLSRLENNRNEQRPIVNNYFQFDVQGVISADNLAQLVEKMSRIVRENGISFESNSTRSPVRRRA